MATPRTNPSASPCNLCPRKCGALRDRGQRGYCGAGAEIRAARAALHYWEEPPISGEDGSGTVFFTYCPLRCVYCQNRIIAEGEAGCTLEAGQLADAFLSLQEQGALNVNCVTPTHYSPQIAEAVSKARSRGLHLPIVWNTSGYELPEVVEWLDGTVDVYLADFKYADKELARHYSNAPDYPEVALRAIASMVETAGTPAYDDYHGQRRMVSGVVVRHMVLPGAVEHSLKAVELLYRTFGDDVLYSIMNQYTPVMAESVSARFPELAKRVDAQDYARVLDFADEMGLDDYFWQDGPAAEESFIPRWDGTGLGQVLP